jgi:hypothetical protein
MPAPTLTTRTPGAPADPAEAAPPDITAGERDTLVTVTQAQLNAMVNAAVAASRVQSPSMPKIKDLPDASSIDVRTLKEMVLTKSGWIVPPRYGMPVAPELR